MAVGGKEGVGFFHFTASMMVLTNFFDSASKLAILQDGEHFVFSFGSRFFHCKAKHSTAQHSEVPLASLRMAMGEISKAEGEAVLIYLILDT